MPGIAEVNGARVSAEFGDDPMRYRPLLLFLDVD